jgi:hypothetical protein
MKKVFRWNRDWCSAEWRSEMTHIVTICAPRQLRGLFDCEITIFTIPLEPPYG